MLDLLLRNARLVFPRVGEQYGSLGVRDGKIAGIYLDGYSPRARRKLDVGARALFPGIIDPHIHLGVRGPYDEEVLTETRAALKGGITTVGCYLRELGSYVGQVEDFSARAEGKLHTDLFFHLVILEPSQIADIPLLAERYGNPAFKFYLHGYPGLPVMDAAGLMEGFRAIAGLKQPGMACVHSENHALCVQGMANLKAGKPKTLTDWTASAPDGAEAEAVRLCAFTAEKTGTPVYIVHLTSAAGLEAVREAKARGVPLYCESTSTYLYYDNADPAGMKVKRHPAIRSAADREALWGGVADGTIETLGTDNVTATAEENNYVGTFWENNGAFPTLATHVTQILHRGHHEQGLPLWLLADRMCLRPAELFGLYPQKGTLQVGADADLTVIDPNLRKTVRGAETASRSDFTPLEGRKLKGWPVTVIKGGEVVVEEGKLLCDPGLGRVLTPVSEP